MAIARDEPRFYVSSRFLVVSINGENSAFPRAQGLDSYRKRLLQAVPAQNPHVRLVREIRAGHYR